MSKSSLDGQRGVGSTDESFIETVLSDVTGEQTRAGTPIGVEPTGVISLLLAVGGAVLLGLVLRRRMNLHQPR